MSYELCNRISINKKDGTIKLTTACNNVYPKIYESWDFLPCIDDDCKEFSSLLDKKLYKLFVDMFEGNIVINTINKSTVDFEYALKKVMEYLKDRNVGKFDLWDVEKSRRKEFYKTLYRVFMQALEEHFEGDYGLVNSNGYSITKTGKYNYHTGDYPKVYYYLYNTSNMAKMSYKQAYIVASGFENLKIIKL